MKQNIIPLLSVGTFIILPLSSCNDIKKNEAKIKPNVIIILADDIGYGDLGFNGKKTIQTPHVDKIAHAGVRFTDAHSVAATSTPSRYSLLTGHYAWRRNDTSIAAGNAGMIIHPQQYTIADMFRDNGYTTAVVGKWHLGLGNKTGEQDWNSLITPNTSDIGFDYSYIMAATGDRTPCVYVENGRIVNLDPNDPISVSYESNFEGEPTGKDNPELLYTMKPSHGHNQSIVNGISRIGYMKGGKSALWVDQNIADSITTHATAFIKENKEAPFFLYLGTNDIHVPRIPHPRFAGKSGMGARGDAILEFDWTVGEIMATLEKHDLTKNTIIIITSDNGPVVDDGYQDQAVELLGNHRPSSDFRGGKYSIFEAGTRVPLVVSWEGKTEPKVSDALVSHIDFMASMEQLLNFKLPSGAAPDSQQQLDALLGKDLKGRHYIVEQAQSLAISSAEWKYIEASGYDSYDPTTDIELGNAKEPQLYNLKKDANEQKNIASQYPQKVEELRAILDKEKAKK